MSALPIAPPSTPFSVSWEELWWAGRENPRRILKPQKAFGILFICCLLMAAPQTGCGAQGGPRCKPPTSNANLVNFVVPGTNPQKRCRNGHRVGLRAKRSTARAPPPVRGSEQARVASHANKSEICWEALIEGGVRRGTF